MRKFTNIVKAVTKPYHWMGILRGFIVYQKPVAILSSYIFGLNKLADCVHLKSDDGVVIYINDQEDILTIHEIFARIDYPVSGVEKIILDIGGNIGISAKYFHLRCPFAKIISFEPDPRNFQYWEKNHSNSNSNLVKLRKYAVVPNEQKFVQFTQLSGSRYGGVGVPGGKKIDVAALSISKVIDDELREFEEIDLLKLDIENMEKEILDSIAPETMMKIKKIYVEFPYGTEYKINGFSETIQGQIHKYERI